MKEVVIAAGVRTAAGTFGKSLRGVPAAELGRHVLEGLMDKTSLAKSEVQEVVFGHGYVHGGGLNSARISAMKAGFSAETPAHVVIKACGSSLKAIASAYVHIAAGEGEVIAAGGVESMSEVPYLVRSRWGGKFGNLQMDDALLADGLICSIGQEHMGETAERLAEMYGISREEQDKFAYDSHRKASEAWARGAFADEIVPFPVKERGEIRIFDQDESVRADVSLLKLSQLKPVFQREGTVTAGNACPMNDGAAAVLLLSRDYAERRGVRPLLAVKSYASAGVAPGVMGIGPVPAVRKALDKAELALEEIGLVELNEAFAAQSIAVIRELGLKPDRVNVNGGAIALGHPVGATGAKLTVTLMHEMLRRGTRYGMVTLCMAGGMGIAMIFQNLCIE